MNQIKELSSALSNNTLFINARLLNLYGLAADQRNNQEKLKLVMTVIRKESS